MRSFHNGSFDPRTLVVLETAFDEAWLTLKSVGNNTVKPDELARCVLRMAMEGECDPVRLHDRGWTATRDHLARHELIAQQCRATRSAANLLTKDEAGRIAKRTSQHAQPMSASLIGRLGSSAFRLSTAAMAMSLAGSCFSTDSARRPVHHGIRRRGGTIY